MQNEPPLASTTTAAIPALSEKETFDLTPVSLWKEDYSGLKRLFEQWRAAGITDLRSYLRQDPSRAQGPAPCRSAWSTSTAARWNGMRHATWRIW